MKKAKLLSLLLALSMLASFAVPVTLAAEPFEDDWQHGNGLNIRKTATTNTDGTYSITLEAYATGSQVITQVTEDIPADIILVLDQSGSMDNNMDIYDFRLYNNKSNDNFYSYRHNGGSGNLYYQLPDGGYASVSVGLVEGGTYSPYASNTPNDYPIIGRSRTNYYDSRNNLYALVGDVYQKVTVKREHDWHMKYTYSLPNGTVIATSEERDSVPRFTGITGNVLYKFDRDSSQNVYTYTYSVQGQTHTIGTSTGINTYPADIILYERYKTGTTTRLTALKSAANLFINSVAEKAKGMDGVLGTDDDVNHRIAVVGFASQSGNGNNTELLSISGSNSGSVGIRYNSISTQNYKDVLQSMNTAAGYQMVQNAINALAANGATRADLGMEMAKNILINNPVAENETRNRVVIMFTDGSPTSSSGFEEDVAQAAFTQGNTIKDSGATVYTIGIFDGADAGSAGSSNGNAIQQSNWFMQRLSSGGGTPNSGYYLSAGDHSTLNNIFQQLSHNVETGGTTTTLTSECVIRDIVAPAFTLPAGTTVADIQVESWACTGVDANGAYTWSKNSDAQGAYASIRSTDTSDPTTTNNQIDVTGFDFQGNYVGTINTNGAVTYRGSKLVISFKAIPRPGFFGGNDVFTNDNAGFYENSDATTPVMTYERPLVNVPLVTSVATAPSANVYLGAYYSETISSAAIAMGATVTIGGYPIDFTRADDPDHPFGLEPWQIEYVDILVEAVADGNDGTFESIQEDIDYTITVSIRPKTPTGSDYTTIEESGTIHVFKPKLTFKDSEVWYGDDMPSGFLGNCADATWVDSTGKTHTDEGVQMLSETPELDALFTAGISGDTVNTKQDIPVKVDIRMPICEVMTNINSHTTFVHKSCSSACAWTTPTANGDPAFLLHVNTCSLTVTKVGGDVEPYVFTILRNGDPYTQATITGNGSITISELPVGTYSIREDSGWSWRFAANNGSTVTLDANNPTGVLVCTNTKTDSFWLNGFSEVVKNIFSGNNP